MNEPFHSCELVILHRAITYIPPTNSSYHTDMPKIDTPHIPSTNVSHYTEYSKWTRSMISSRFPLSLSLFRAHTVSLSLFPTRSLSCFLSLSLSPFHSLSPLLLLFVAGFDSKESEFQIKFCSTTAPLLEEEKVVEGERGLGS